jgi:hypothetical protein
VTRRRALILLVLFGLAPLLVAQSGDDFVVPDGRSAALGGRHRALADGFQTLFANPAGLLELEPQFSYSQLGVRVTGPMFSIASIVLESLGGADIETLLAKPSVQDLLRGIYARFSLTGPVSFGYVGGGMGFGVFNDTHLILESLGSSSLEIRVGERFLARGGYAIGIPLPAAWDARLAAGIGLNAYVRGDSVVSTSLLTLPSVIGSFGPSLLSDSPFELVSGIGLDAGLRYVWRDTLAAALTVDNVYAPNVVLAYPTTSGFLDSTGSAAAPVYDALAQEIGVGVAYTPAIGRAERYVQNLTVLFDYEDIFDFWIDPANAENLVLKMGLGVEATFLEVLSVRAGVGQGLLAAGIGIDLTYLTLNAAMFGTELSGEPGLRPVYNLTLGLEFPG